MLVLALETSCRRGSVALVDSGRILADAWHDEANAHGERMLGLIDAVFLRARRLPAELTHVAAGRGPGAFTGLRVGLALAQGIASGYGIPAVGVGSLRAMAMGMPVERQGLRWPIVDARRGELFVACFDADGTEIVGPRPLSRQGFADSLSRLRKDVPLPPREHCVLGHALTEVPGLERELREADLGFAPFRSDATDWPSAGAIGQVVTLGGEVGPAAPEYLRDADATIPNLPPSPLLQPYRVGG